MSRLATIPTAQMSEEQRLYAQAVRAAALGARAVIPSVPDGPLVGPAEASLRNPTMGTPLSQLIWVINSDQPSLPRELVELAILITVRRHLAQFPFRAHANLAAGIGLSPAIIEAIRVGSPIEATDPGQTAVMDFLDEYTRTNRISDESYARYRATLGETGIVELVVVVGIYSLVAMTTNVFDIDVPEGEPRPIPV
jgi:4-carboxymuconolactone decarboxylase